MRGTEPDFGATEALSVAWSEATLEYLHDLSCEDPLTGLTSLAHVRTRLAEVYRDAELSDVGVQNSHALVVVALRARGAEALLEPHFTRALRLAQVAEAVRAVFSGGQTIGRLGLTPRRRSCEPHPGPRHLRRHARGLPRGPRPRSLDVRVWIEGLPASSDSAARLLDELAR